MSKRIEQLLHYVEGKKPIPSSSASGTLTNVPEEISSCKQCGKEAASSRLYPLSLLDLDVTSLRFTEIYLEKPYSSECHKLLAATPFSDSPSLVQGVFLWGCQVGLGVLRDEQNPEEVEAALSTPSLHDSPARSGRAYCGSSTTARHKEKSGKKEKTGFLSVKEVLQRWEASLVKDILPLLYFFTFFPSFLQSRTEKNRIDKCRTVVPRPCGFSSFYGSQHSSSMLTFPTHCLVLQWILYTWAYTLGTVPSTVSEGLEIYRFSSLKHILLQVSAASWEIVEGLVRYRSTLEYLLSIGKREGVEQDERRRGIEKEKQIAEEVLFQVRETNEALAKFASSAVSGSKIGITSAFPFLGEEKERGVHNISELAYCIQQYIFCPEEYLLFHLPYLYHNTQPFVRIQKDNWRKTMYEQRLHPDEKESEWVEEVNAWLTMTATS